MANPVPESGSFYENVKDFLGAPAGGPVLGAAVTAPTSGLSTFRLGSGLAPPMYGGYGGFTLGSAVAPPMIGNIGYGFGYGGFGGSPGLGMSAPFVSRPPMYGAPLATARPVSYGPTTLPYQASYQPTASALATPVPVSPGPVSRSMTSFQPPLVSSAPFTVRGVSSYAPTSYPRYAPTSYPSTYAPMPFGSGVSYGGSRAGLRY